MNFKVETLHMQRAKIVCIFVLHNQPEWSDRFDEGSQTHANSGAMRGSDRALARRLQGPEQVFLATVVLVDTRAAVHIGRGRADSGSLRLYDKE